MNIHRRPAPIAVLALVLCASACSGLSERQITLYEENDALAVGHPTDESYTQGLRISTRIDPESAAWFERAAHDGLPHISAFQWLEPDGTERFEPLSRVGWFLGQSLYTPKDTEREDLIEDDQPYAGWLYFGVADETLYVARDDPRDDFRVHHELVIGVVGEPALAEDMQETFHTAFDWVNPQGWDNQLETEPGIVLSSEYEARLTSTGIDEVGADLSWMCGYALGNVTTHAEIGVNGRFGINLSRGFIDGVQTRDFAPGAAYSATNSGLTVPVEGGAPASFYVLGGISVRGVLHNIFLDGNTFSSSHSVDSEPFVVAGFLGLAYENGDCVLQFVGESRSREFTEQEEGRHDFGSLRIGFSWLF